MNATELYQTTVSEDDVEEDIIENKVQQSSISANN